MQWQHVEGGITRGDVYTTISVGATTEHGSYGQTVAISNERAARPDVFARTMDFMVRDIGLRVNDRG